MWFYTTKPDEVITLSDQRLPWSPNEKYLGVELDSKMNFTPKYINAAAQGKKNINALKVVSSLTDISAHILKGVTLALLHHDTPSTARVPRDCARVPFQEEIQLTACVQPAIEYGAIITRLMCKTSVTTLQRVQNQGMRLILGISKWTCTTSMSQELSMLPVRVRNEIAVAKLVDKIRFIPSHPLHVSCARPTVINKERSKWLIK